MVRNRLVLTIHNFETYCRFKITCNSVRRATSIFGVPGVGLKHETAQ